MIHNVVLVLAGILIGWLVTEFLYYLRECECEDQPLKDGEDQHGR